MPEESVDILDAVRQAVRVSSKDFDDELLDEIAAARSTMEQAGVVAAIAADDSDPLVRQGIKTYVKSVFGRDNSESEKFMRSFREILRQMQNSADYTGVRDEV